MGSQTFLHSLDVITIIIPKFYRFLFFDPLTRHGTTHMFRDGADLVQSHWSFLNEGINHFTVTYHFKWKWDNSGFYYRFHGCHNVVIRSSYGCLNISLKNLLLQISVTLLNLQSSEVQQVLQKSLQYSGFCITKVTSVSLYVDFYFRSLKKSAKKSSIIT